VRRAIVALFALAAAMTVVDLARSEFVQPSKQLLDLRVGYCAGAAVDAHRDPYRVEPVRSCEHEHPAPLIARTPNLVMPWVSPGYDLLPFAVLAHLPFDAAAFVFTLAGLAALIAATVLIARTTTTPLVYVCAALGFSAALPSLALGQTVSFELLAIAATAAALRAGRQSLAGACAAATCIEPHVGLFTCVAVGVLVPGARVALAAAIAALGALAIASTGLPIQVAYVLRDLPLQAAAQVAYPEQFSLAYALSYAGLPARAALAAGALSTLVLLVLSVGLAWRLRERNAAFAVYLPAAGALVGGTYVHLTQIALAVPAALLMFNAADSARVRALAASALVLLAVPWPYPATFKQLLPAALLVVGLLVWYVSAGSVRRTLGAAALCWLMLLSIESVPTGPPPIIVVARAAAGELATIPAAESTRAPQTPEPLRFAVKLATWAGLLALLLSAAALARRPLRARGTEGATRRPAGAFTSPL